ncbi:MULTISPECIES: sulfotransferase family protein [Streptomyces]|uniref:sulfotransferase family protein n=1 Tax=Streptomyces TaxID=1883 RepID=UPI0019070B1A|nr:sulfotransferase family protein [Streptomyces sp. XC 2026]QQN77703.1 sulfotransferase family protein [Streptomyces sp. XC 2026]
MLKLINAGLGRTGTTSLQVALEKLGFGACFHMFDIVGSEERLAQWEKIVCDGQPADWTAVFDGYTSAVDGPCALYYPDIAAAFPDAKIMLTVRDPDSWYRSTYDTLYQFAVRGARNPAPPGSRPARMGRLTNTLVWQGLFEGRFEDKAFAIDVYHRHNQRVIDTVGADNLLVWDVTQGWEPLCAFLGVPAPRGEDFPHVNDTASMLKVIRGMGGSAG